MSIVPQQHAFLKDVAKLIYFADQQGIMLSAGEMYRTKEQQALYVENGRSKTMNSNHRNRLAVDLNFFIYGVLTYDKAELQVLGDYWEALHKNNRWGGNWENFIDTPHFQRSV